MNDWDTIEKMINTLPQWDVIKWAMSIQEELKCAKEDDLYQLKQNKILQSKIDKAIEIDKIARKNFNKQIPRNIREQGFLNEIYNYLCDIEDILKEDK